MSRSPAHRVAFVLLVVASVATAQTAGPSGKRKAAASIPLVKSPACPFECCQFGAWTAVSALPVFKAPSRTASPVFTLSPGKRFEALTGYVVIRRPGKAVMLTASPPLKVGDEVAVLSSKGEGAYEAWFEGYVYEVGLLTEPLGGYSAAGGALAVVKRPAETVWWVHIRLPDGRAGWIHPDASSRVGGSDGCG
jgi:hypothetical protein